MRVRHGRVAGNSDAILERNWVNSLSESSYIGTHPFASSSSCRKYRRRTVERPVPAANLIYHLFLLMARAPGVCVVSTNAGPARMIKFRYFSNR